MKEGKWKRRMKGKEEDRMDDKDKKEERDKIQINLYENELVGRSQISKQRFLQLIFFNFSC